MSYDLSLRKPLDLADGTPMTAIEMQWEYLDRAKKYAEEHGLDCIGAPEIGAEVLRRWEQVLTGSRPIPMALAGQVDWVAKYRLVDGYRAKHGLRWDDARLRGDGPAVPRPAARSASLAAAGAACERLTTDAEVAEAVTEPPHRHPGLLPGQVPPAVGAPDRGGQLGFDGVRHRRRPATAGADDGSDTWNRGACG